MADIIAVAQQKGGAGKTMLAANLAVCLGRHASVALLDIDQQGSLTRWHRLRQGAGKAQVVLHLSEIASWRLAAELERLSRVHDIVIIDTPPQIELDARLAIRSATLVLVPIQPSLPDLWAAEGTLALAAAERRPARVVLNRAPATGALRRQVEAALAKSGVAQFATVIGNRAGLSTAFASGLAVGETAPKSAAAAEMAALAGEITALLGRGA